MAAAQHSEWRPPREHLVALRGGNAYPTCDGHSHCVAAQVGPYLGLFYLAPLSRWVSAGLGFERAHFAYHLDTPSLPRRDGATHFGFALLRARPLRTRWHEGALDFGLGIGSNSTGGEGFGGPGAHVGAGLGFRPAPELFFGPYAQWVIVLAGGRGTDCDATLAGCSSPRAAHQSFSAFGLELTFTFEPAE